VPLKLAGAGFVNSAVSSKQKQSSKYTRTCRVLCLELRSKCHKLFKSLCHLWHL